MLKNNKESSKKYDHLHMLAYVVCENFESSELVILISLLNTTTNNIIHAQIFKNINLPQFEIIIQKVLLKNHIEKNPHQIIWKSRFPLILIIKCLHFEMISSLILILKNETQLTSFSYSFT